jgi:4'-phosphopantetheinyl transferase
VARLETLLSRAERERADRLRDPVRRGQAIVARAMLRLLLAGYLRSGMGASPARFDTPELAALAARVTIDVGPTGKPYLPAASGIHFSLAHSGDLAIYAIARHSVGVDVEQIARETNDLPLSSCCASELAELLAVGEPERSERFFQLWARKEAFLKATGEGLLRPMNTFIVGAGPGRSSLAVPVLALGGEELPWAVADLAPAAGYAAAVAAAGIGWHIVCRALSET